MNKSVFVKTLTKGGGVVAAALFVRVLVGFGTQVILARMLEPELFGIVAFATAVAMFFNSFVNLHGDKFVIQQKGDPHHALNVAYTMEVVVAIVFILLVFFLAPFVMGVLDKSEHVIFVQFLALAFLYNPASLPRALLEKELSFFKSKFPFIVSQIFSAGLAIYLAYVGYGIWSLLWWRLSVLIGESLILWFIVSYKLRFAWDKDVAKKILKFSWPLVLSAFLAFFYYNVDNFIIGQYLEDGDKQLGYYWLAFQAGSYVLIFREVIFQVLFPMFSKMNDDALKVKIFEKLTHAVAAFFIVLTVIAVLFANELILFVYGVKWKASIFPFQIIFITIMMRAISSNIGYLLYSRGETMPDLVIAIVFSVLLPPLAYFSTINYGINGTAVSVLIVQIISVIFSYQRYIKPLTGKSVVHYFFWPWLISVLTLFTVYLSDYYGVSLLIKFVGLLILLLITYFSLLRYVVRDVMDGMKVLKDD